nr:Chain A, PROTEIN (ALPHA2D) [synthetic construct]1QP6_B Chain B, PROTEIN (ALPHA2D) [synthetic construct]
GEVEELEKKFKELWKGPRRGEIEELHKKFHELIKG